MRSFAQHLQKLQVNKQDTIQISFALLDLDNVGKIHGIWGRTVAGYIISIYERELDAFIRNQRGTFFMYARGDEFEVLTCDYSAKELEDMLCIFRVWVLARNVDKHFISLSSKKTEHTYRGSYFEVTDSILENAQKDIYNDGVLYFPNFSAGISQGDFAFNESIVAITDALRFFSTAALNEAKTTKGINYIFPGELEITSKVSPKYDFSTLESQLKKYKKKAKRNVHIDDHHVDLEQYDHFIKKNPYSKFKKYLLFEFLWHGDELEKLAKSGIELRGGIDGYGLKGMIHLVDPNTLYYVIAQNMDSAVKILNKYRINYRNSKLTRFLDRLEVYFNRSLTNAQLVELTDALSAEINANLKELPVKVDVRVFVTYRKASHARKTASFRSYTEFVSKIEAKEADTWKTYTLGGNVVAIYNRELPERIIDMQNARARDSYASLAQLSAN